MFIDGNFAVTTTYGSALATILTTFGVGNLGWNGAVNAMDYISIDEARLSRGIARWTTTVTASGRAAYNEPNRAY